MLSTASSIFWGVSYPVRALWHYNSASRIAELEEQLQAAIDCRQHYVSLARRIDEGCNSLTDRVQQLELSLPIDHRRRLIDKQALYKPLLDIERQVLFACVRLKDDLDTCGPDALSQLKGKWIVVGEDYEELKTILEKIKRDQQVICEAKEKLTTQGVIIAGKLTQLAAESQETPSIARGIAWVGWIAKEVFWMIPGTKAAYQVGEFFTSNLICTGNEQADAEE